MKEITRQIRKKGIQGTKIPTLCWYCQNAVPDNDGHGCSWSARLEPVEGGRAVQSQIYSKDGGGDTRRIASYRVEDCPQFVEDPLPDIGVDPVDAKVGTEPDSPKKETLKEKKARLSRGGAAFELGQSD